MKSYWKYLLYILEHKLNVLLECWKEGLYVQGMMHDMSKFNPIEFFPYARKFYLNKKLDEFEWEYAWLHHQHHNKHHWNYWVVDSVKREALPMPRKYLLEMICDYRSFSRTWGRKRIDTDMADRLIRNLLTEKVILHPKTRKECEFFIRKINESNIAK
ncbi:DUF5662 family protein [Fictibacillus barbaricus]|uniref:Catalase n=1 Tax=Fictibacillus barbaricus TaxID=182136 RepID=A0ABS2ZAF5_9BACL|nr:DUF5662 family protein [Fictibacillus barbaricus]MBN3545183.1 hypothetical protein [Fictibacillus barbaricus]GGB61017.1 hypothetical protein GCM10007199_28620 [Fictibacillus barbaricus]